MTYKEYDNVFIDESGTSCIPIASLMSKNIKWFGLQHETGSDRNLVQNATGEIVEITNFIADPVWYVYSIGVGDYIYGVEVDDGYNVSVFEYFIPEETKTSVLTWMYDDIFRLDFIYLSYLEPHKILAAVNGSEYDYDIVNLVDFTNNTCTLELEIENFGYCEFLYADTINGHIKAFVIDYDGIGWSIYYKDFTTNGSWNYSYFSVPETDWQYEDFSICDNRYICAGNYIDATNDRYCAQLQIICFDMQTDTWQKSNIVNAYSFSDNPNGWQVYWDESFYYGAPYCNWMTAHISNGKLYFANHGYGWGDYNEPPPYNHGVTYGLYFRFFGEYDPTSNTLSCIQTNGWTAWDTYTMGTRFVYCASTKDVACFVIESDDGLYSIDMGYIGTSYGRYYGFSLLDNEYVQYVVAEDSRIEARDPAGNLVRYWDLGATYDWVGIMVVGNGIIVEADTDSGDYVIHQLLLK
jgi:hypothetical protein